MTNQTANTLIRAFNWVGYVCACLVVALMAGCLYYILTAPWGQAG